MTYTPIKTAERTAGAVIKLLFLPCAATPWMYVETGIEALLKVVLLYNEPDPKHIYHKLFGKTIVCELKSVNNAYDVIEPTNSQAGRRFLFKFLEGIDRAVWLIYLIDIASEGLVKWSSGLMRLAGCNHHDHPDSEYGHQPSYGTPSVGDYIDAPNYVNESGNGQYWCFPSAQIGDTRRGAMAGSDSLYAGGLSVPTSSRTIIAETGQIVDDNSNLILRQDPKDHSITWGNWNNPGGLRQTLVRQLYIPDFGPGVRFVAGDGSAYSSSYSAID
uniref:Uncharacterized protein n=1 Tax=uncultured prokaryote TaxID=198431 RepID=A0A0H5Q3H9_9ZZZZ|nr:hypothetical protein [uncultured prokaryote]